MAAQKYYTVNVCFSGCLPENEPSIYTRKRDALDYAATIVDEYREQEGTRVSGSKKEGYWAATWGDYGSGVSIEVLDITNQVRVCPDCVDGFIYDGMKFCYRCDGTGLETF